MPLAVRLIAIYALVVGAALLVVAALAVQLTRSHLNRQLESRLVAVTTSFEQGPAATITDVDQLAGAARDWLATQPPPADQAVVVRTAGGELLSTRSGLALGEVEGTADLLASTEGGWTTLDSPDGELRALTVPLTLNDEPAGTLVVAASTETVDAGVGDLLRQVLWACAAGFVLAVVLGLLALRRTLRPLEHIASDIDAIQSSGDVSQRVRVGGPADEVGRLGLAFNRTLGRLQQVVESQRQFVADASHELRTPLTVVRGQLELLGDDDALPDAGSRRSLDIAVGELDRMGRMVHDLLLLARLDEGLDLKLEPVDVELVVGEARLRALPPGGPETATADSDVPVGLMVLADSTSLLQVLTNLMVNAVHHGGGSIGVASRTNGTWVAISVADDGPGIPLEDQPHVFERFYRGSNPSGGSGGAGLGLAIAKGLTERMGGTLICRSQPGEGTTFTVELPAARMPSPPPAPM